MEHFGQTLACDLQRFPDRQRHNQITADLPLLPSPATLETEIHS